MLVKYAEHLKNNKILDDINALLRYCKEMPRQIEVIGAKSVDEYFDIPFVLEEMEDSYYGLEVTLEKVKRGIEQILAGKESEILPLHIYEHGDSSSSDSYESNESVESE